MASPLHFDLSLQLSHVGSVHDYTIHKECYLLYFSYLQKIFPEKQVTFLNTSTSWVISLSVYWSKIRHLWFAMH